MLWPTRKTYAAINNDGDKNLKIETFIFDSWWSWLDSYEWAISLMAFCVFFIAWFSQISKFQTMDKWIVFVLGRYVQIIGGWRCTIECIHVFQYGCDKRSCKLDWIILFFLWQFNCWKWEEFTESSSGTIATRISCLHWRRAEDVPWRLEIWFIFHNNNDRVPHLDALGYEKVGEKINHDIIWNYSIYSTSIGSNRLVGKLCKSILIP